MKNESEFPRMIGLPEPLLLRLDEGWDHLEVGDVEAAGCMARELLDETAGHPEVRFLLAAALLESGYPRESLAELEDCRGKVEDDLLHRYYLASAHYENLEMNEAEHHFRKILETEPTAPPPHYGLAQVLEFTGRFDEAEEHYEIAYEREPEAYPLPTRMKPEAFSGVVAQALDLLPEVLQPHARRVPVVVEPLPSLETLTGPDNSNPITPGVLGLFVGPNLREAEASGQSVPSTIFLYQRNLERLCQTREQLIYEIRLTLYHEFGHYLGLSEEELEERGLG